MVKIYKQPFAHDGDAIAVPDASQPDGKMSSADGWTPDYQLKKTDPNYKPVGRQEMNGVFKEVTEALGQVQVQGSASWSAVGAPYPINAQVYHNGKQWLALRANSVEPAEGEDWSAVMTQKAVTDAINNSAIGIGQTWQDVKAQRVQDTNYTNNTGRPIAVMVTTLAQEGSSPAELKINGLVVSSSSITQSGVPTVVRDPLFSIVGLGDEYLITGALSLVNWTELR